MMVIPVESKFSIITLRNEITHHIVNLDVVTCLASFFLSFSKVLGMAYEAKTKRREPAQRCVLTEVVLRVEY
jgi:hypothetical protein